MFWTDKFHVLDGQIKNFKPIDNGGELRYHNTDVSEILNLFPAFLPYVRETET